MQRVGHRESTHSRQHARTEWPNKDTQHIGHPEMEVATPRIGGVLGCSSFVISDFMIDTKPNMISLIGIKPRPVGTAHRGRSLGQDAVGALKARLQKRPEPQELVVSQPDQPIAPFP